MRLGERTTTPHNHVIKIYDSDERLIQVVPVENAFAASFRSTKYPIIRKAILAAEDRWFDHHLGVSLRGITRAAVNNLLGTGVVQGGSSITQQSVRTALGLKGRMSRKLVEAMLAPAITLICGRSRILDFYAMNVYWGFTIKGISAASQVYFRKPADRLMPLEALVLTCMLSRPNFWRRHPESLARKAASVGLRNRIEARDSDFLDLSRRIARNSLLYQSRRAEIPDLTSYVIKAPSF
jgi:membrane peptidoglycan carboxypeptidase